MFPIICPFLTAWNHHVSCLNFHPRPWTLNRLNPPGWLPRCCASPPADGPCPSRWPFAAPFRRRPRRSAGEAPGSWQPTGSHRDTSLRPSMDLSFCNLFRSTPTPSGLAGVFAVAPNLSGHCRTSARCQREHQIECQKECQNRCQIECQTECQR